MAVVVVDVPDLLGTGNPGDAVLVGVSVVGGKGPGPSGSTTVVGTGPLVVGLVVLVGTMVSGVVTGGVVVGVVVVGVVLEVVLGRVSTLVRGTQV